MQYTKDNILNLRFRRGGVSEYVATKIMEDKLQMRQVGVNVYRYVTLHNALLGLNSGKWQVVGAGRDAVVENVYQIF